jgi:hypothetical protein
MENNGMPGALTFVIFHVHHIISLDGWDEFRRDNNFGGNECVFELFKRNPVVLYVLIFHVSG